MSSGPQCTRLCGCFPSAWPGRWWGPELAAGRRNALDKFTFPNRFGARGSDGGQSQRRSWLRTAASRDALKLLPSQVRGVASAQGPSVPGQGGARPGLAGSVPPLPASSFCPAKPSGLPLHQLHLHPTLPTSAPSLTHQGLHLQRLHLPRLPELASASRAPRLPRPGPPLFPWTGPSVT